MRVKRVHPDGFKFSDNPLQKIGDGGQGKQGERDWKNDRRWVQAGTGHGLFTRFRWDRYQKDGGER